MMNWSSAERGSKPRRGGAGALGLGEGDGLQVRWSGRRSHPDQVAQCRGLRGRRRHPLVERAVEDKPRQIRVPVEVDQFLFYVAVVDVHRHQPGLERPQDRLEVLDPVVEVQTQVFARPEARADEVVGDPVGGGVQLEEGETPLGARTGMVDVQERLTVGDHVHDRLEQVGKVVLHRSS